MKCKHCENEIKNDCKFCSFCGVKTEMNTKANNVNSLIKDETDALEDKGVDPKHIDKYKGYYVVGLVFFVLFTFQFVLRSMFLANQGLNGILYYLYLFICLAMAGIPILISKYSKTKEHKFHLIIIGLILIVITFFNISRNEMHLPFWIGVLLYASPYALFIFLLRKTKNKTMGAISIKYIVSTFYGIVLVLTTLGQVFENDYYGIAHLAIVISYPVINLIIGLINRLISRSSIKS